MRQAGTRRPVVGVMGAAQASPACRADARAVGRLLAEHGWIVLTGGRPHGVMAAATAGAKEIPGSLTVGILPGRDAQAADGVDVAIVTGMGDARNAINVLSCQAVVACGVEGAGTASEVALALKAAVPVVLLGADPEAITHYRRLTPSGLTVADSPEAVIQVLLALGLERGPPWPG